MNGEFTQAVADERDSRHLFDFARLGREASVLAPLRATTNYHSMSGLSALQNTAKHVYAGTVDPKEVARRRAANKKARAARKRRNRALKNR